MIQGIGVAYLHSAHGAKLAEWYSKTLGFPIASEFPGWTEFKTSAGPRFAVDHVSFPASVVEKQAVMLSFQVDDLAAEVKALAAKGVPFYPSAEKAIFDVGPSLVATFADPDGNWMQLHQPKK
jgi:predicted enzyme related to lactoylglutathione lyase